MRQRLSKPHAFTLVEILIVVVILGILSAIVVPQFASATIEAKQTAIADQVAKLRRVLAVYYARNSNTFPSITAGDSTWGELLMNDPVYGTYMRQPPLNPWVGQPNGRMITIGTGPDSAYQANYGWIFNPVTGELWAGSCDGADQPLPLP